jgi:protein O-mannosyl-transferase
LTWPCAESANLLIHDRFLFAKGWNGGRAAGPMIGSKKLPQTTARNHSALILGLILSWATLSVYWQVKDHEFITCDDYEYVVQNPFVRIGVTTQNLAKAFTAAHACNWHPLTWISHMLDSQLFGVNPSGHHMSSVVLHLAGSLLLFRFLLLATKALWKSILVAGLFSLHPLHVESVAWVAERKDVLCGLFWMLTLLAYRRYTASPCRSGYLLALLIYGLGLMTKPMLMTLPFILLLVDYWPLGRLDPGNLKARLIVEKIPFLLLAAGSAILTFSIQGQCGAVTDQIPFLWRVVNAVHSYAVYLLKTFWPHPLAFHYPHPLGSIPLWQTLISAVILGLITFFSFRYHRRLPFLTVGWLWYLGTLFPVIGLIQVGSQGMADRYTYIPLIGVFIVLSWGSAGLSARWKNWRPAMIALWVCFIAALSYSAWRQTGCWRDSITLYEQAVQAHPEDVMARNNLGNALAREGRLQEAENHLREALRWSPDHAPAHNNLGNVLAAQGKIHEGIHHYQEALRLQPDLSEARFNLESALRKIPTGRVQ